MKRFLLLLSLVVGMLLSLRAQYQFDHVKVLESQSQSDLGIRYQVIDQSTNERIICARLNTGSFNFDPGSRSTLLQGSSDNNVEYVAKYDDSGALVWAHLIRADLPTISIQDLKVTNNGDIYISLYHNGGSSAGGNDIYFDPTSTTPTNSFSTSDKFLIAKYDKDFVYQWSRAFQGTANNDNIKLTVTNAGIAASMSTFGEFDLNPDPVSSTNFGSINERSIGITVLDTNGDYLDGFGLSGSINNNTSILDLESDGSNIYLVGHPGSSTSASIDLDPSAVQNLVTGNKAFIAKYDASLNLLLKLSIADKRYDRQLNLHVANTNLIYATGSFNGTKDFGGSSSSALLESNGLADLFVAQYDGNLDIQWASSWGGVSDDAYRGADLINNGIAMQAKSFEDIVFIQGDTEAKIATGSYLISFDENGGFSWYKDFKSVDLVPLGLSSDANFNLYPVGRYRSVTADFNPNDFFSESVTASGTSFDLTMSKFTPCIPLTKTTNLIGCPGESFEIDGTTYTEDRTIYRFASAANGCDSVLISEVQIYPGAVMQASATPTNPSDCGLTDGQLILTASGGTAPYTYTLDGGTPQSSATFTGLTYGIYEIDIADANGCSVSLTETLKDPVENNGFELEPTTPMTITNATCAGAADGTVILNFINFMGSPVDYSLNGGIFIPLASTTFDNLAVGNYTLDLRTIDGCVQPLAFSITEPEPLSFSITSTTNASCLNTADGTIELIASGGIPSYSYSTDGMNYQAFSAAETTTIGSVGSGNVVVYVKDANGCTISTATTVGVDVDNLAPSFTSSATINVDENVSGTFYTALATDNCGIDAYSIIGGADQSAFTLSGSGELSFVNPPDFESPADVGADNTYDIIVEAIDPAGNTVNLNIEISVNDLIEPIVWSGAVDADWGTSGNWSDENLPTVDDIVSIPTTATNMPVVSGDYAVDDIIIALGAEVTITKESSLAILGTFSGAGTVTASRNTTGSSGYSILGSPLSDTDLTDLNADFLYDYDGTNHFSPTGPMTPGKGYFFAYNTVSPEVTLTGPPNHGTVSIAVTTSGDAFNLVANPYLAAIDRASFVAANTSAIDGNIWLWNDGGANAGANRGGDYILTNNLGVASTIDLGDGIAGSKTLPTTNTPITSFQGFLVSATANASIAFEPTMQTSAAGSNADGNFYRKADEEYATIKLSLSNDENYNETLVGLVDGATYGQDYGLDGAYRSVNPDFAFYSKMDDQKMAIQALPVMVDSKVEVPLVIHLKFSGVYQLRVKDLANLDQANVSLRNQVANEEMLLTENANISLALEAGSTTHYSLVFEPMEVLVLDGYSDIALTRKSQSLELRANFSGRQEVKIYDLSGRVKYNEVILFEDHKALLPAHLENDQVYILRVQNQSIKFIFK